MKLPLLAVCALALAGCAGPADTFYRTVLTNTETAPYSGKTEVFRVENKYVALQTMKERGYVLIGEARFEGTGRITESMIKRKAKEVGADVVLWTSETTGEAQRSVSVPVYQPGQTTTTNATVRTNTGQSAYGTATTQTSGTFNNVPVTYSVAVQEHDILFLRKAAR